MRVPSRRLGVVVLVGLVLGGAVVVAGARLLRPVSLPVALEDVPSPPASCDDPGEPPHEVSSGVLLTCPSVFDERRVQISGEVVGDVLGQGPRRWVQVNDDAYAWTAPLSAHHTTLGTNAGMAVLLPPGVRPVRLGGPGQQGDRVQVTGRFDATAAEDQGGPAVLADAVVVLAEGRAVPSRAVPGQRAAAVIMATLAGGLWGLSAHLHRRRRYR